MTQHATYVSSSLAHQVSLLLLSVACTCGYIVSREISSGKEDLSMTILSGLVLILSFGLFLPIIWLTGYHWKLVCLCLSLTLETSTE